MANHPGTREHKNTPAASVSPTTRNLEWAAGFLEGEGTFWVSDRKRKYVAVSAEQEEREPLDRLQKYFGGSVRYYRHKSVTPNGNLYRNPNHRWLASGARARGVMMTLYSLLSLRRRQQIRRAFQR